MSKVDIVIARGKTIGDFNEILYFIRHMRKIKFLSRSYSI